MSIERSREELVEKEGERELMNGRVVVEIEKEGGEVKGSSSLFRFDIEGSKSALSLLFWRVGGYRRGRQGASSCNEPVRPRSTPLPPPPKAPPPPRPQDLPPAC